MNRLLEYLITAWLILTINFALPRIIPGDPLLYLTGEASGDASVAVNERTREKLRHYYNLDQPLSRQYLVYLAGLLSGDLGYSIYYKTPVTELIIKTAPWTLLIMITAIILSTVFGTGLGVFSAWKHGHRADKGLLIFASGTMAMPSFILAILLQIIFSVKLGVLPVSGSVTLYENYSSVFDRLLDIVRHMILPTIALTAVLLGENYLLTRNTMINILNTDYIFVARMKGLPTWIILYRHALRNALLPILTQVSLRLGLAVGGMIFVETIFSYPGMGNLLYRSVITHDYAVTQGVFVVITLTVMSVNFGMEYLHQCIDPRIRNNI